MWSELEKVFKSIGIPYYRQSSLIEGDTLPKEYYTFWNNDTKDLSYYDNENHSIEWSWEVWSYTKDARRLYAVMDDFIAEAKAKGFILRDKGKDVNSEDNGIFGRYTQIKYFELKE